MRKTPPLLHPPHPQQDHPHKQTQRSVRKSRRARNRTPASATSHSSDESTRTPKTVLKPRVTTAQNCAVLPPGRRHRRWIMGTCALHAYSKLRIGHLRGMQAVECVWYLYSSPLITFTPHTHIHMCTHTPTKRYEDPSVSLTTAQVFTTDGSDTTASILPAYEYEYESSEQQGSGPGKDKFSVIDDGYDPDAAEGPSRVFNCADEASVCECTCCAF